ncbi:MAG: cobalamin-binding protein [Anaerolineales bacterium]|nr:cobalamin-binding protein [Anaerolineales bacterium]
MIRIASLLPSATEIVCALGFADCLVGVSHECDYPPDVVADLPRLTRSAVPPGLSSAEIDADVAARLRRGESLYTVDEAQLAALAPDVIITQELCDVCAVNFSQVRALSARLPGRPKVISLTPPNLEGILEDVRTVAGVLGVPERGERLVAQLRAQLAAVAESVRGRPRPRVFACEWLDPPYAAGHWVPEMIALAGGEEVLGRAGERSFRVTWEQVAAARPDVVVLIPCGYTREQAEAEWEALPKPAVLEDIPAVRNGRVYALEANNYCSRPAPRVVEGVEALARVFHAVTG